MTDFDDKRMVLIIAGGASLAAEVAEILSRRQGLSAVIAEPDLHLHRQPEPIQIEKMIMLPSARYDREWTHPRSPRKQKGRRHD